MFISFFLPFIYISFFAVYKYVVFKKLVIIRHIATMSSVFAVSEIGLSTTNGDMKILYERVFDDYKEEVKKPHYKGRKLSSKKPKIDEELADYPCSNFDEVKELLRRNTKNF